PGKYTAVIKYAGDENYDATEYRVNFVIPGADTSYIIWIILGVILFTVATGIVFAAARKRSRMK
ncbi:MAG: hypothetical protein LBE09_08600, partial [Christensenellaceae bacterium]|nr:hypothetical protein [Christensenellaceae bacterium]